MSEHKTNERAGIRNGDKPQPLGAEQFCINEPELKKTTPIRNCPDAQLQRVLEGSMEQQKQFLNAIMVAITELQKATALAAVCGYEMDRRKRPGQLIVPH